MDIDESSLVTSETLLGLGKTLKNGNTFIQSVLGSTRETNTASEPVEIDAETPSATEEDEAEVGGSTNAEEDGLITSETPLGPGKTFRGLEIFIRGSLDSAQDDEPTEANGSTNVEESVLNASETASGKIF